jgi:hypothetical protein
MSGGVEVGEVIEREVEGDDDESDGSESEAEGELISKVAMLSERLHGSRARAWIRRAWPSCLRILASS